MSSIDGVKNHIQAPQYNQTILPPQKPRKKRFWKWFFIILIILLATGGFVAAKYLTQANKIFTNKHNIFTRVGQLISSDDKPLQGEEQGKVNILLLGMGGPGHEGPYLTDTMIVASINVQTKDVELISIPRDFMVKLSGRGYNKINAAYAYAESDKEGTGGEAAIKVAEQVTGLTIPYYAAIDFKGFVKAVDHVGGLDITIDRTFTDSSYPNYNLGYLPPQTFTKGTEHMNGERALIFARSRHGNNGEGSDFARSDRQKKVMVALRDELTKLNINDLGTLNSLLGDFTDNFRTNLEPYELKRVADLGKDISDNNVVSLSLDPDGVYICDGLYDLNTGKPSAPLPPPPPPTSPSTTPTPDSTGTETEGTGSAADTTPVTPAPTPAPAPNSRIYVVVPCAGKTIADITAHFQAQLNIAKIAVEKATIEVQNTTGKASVLETWKELSRAGLDVKFTTGKTPLDRSIIYDNSNGSKPKTLDYIKATHTIDESDLPYTSSTADFVIILGKDAL